MKKNKIKNILLLKFISIMFFMIAFNITRNAKNCTIQISFLIKNFQQNNH